MKIIFLDIDGVLNSAVDSARGGATQTYDLAPRPIRLLNTLISNTGAKVVLSSSWRVSSSPPQIQSMLEDEGFTGEIISFTPDLFDLANTRGNEILYWIKDHENLVGDYEKYKNYVILDDVPDMLYCQKDNFIHTDSYIGLTPNDIYRAEDILNANNSITELVK